MKLHDNKEAFLALVHLASDWHRMDPALIEKDYYVTLFLKELAGKVSNLLFKGGTSLSKCYGIIDRFSEDIDLTLDEAFVAQSQRRNLKKRIVESCDVLGFEIQNMNEIKSRRDYNRYIVQYPSHHHALTIRPSLLIETAFFSKPTQGNEREASSLIAEYLMKTGNAAAVFEYGLEPFPIRAQSLERTFVDKVFALCDYAMDRRIERNSRHIYDLYRLFPFVSLDERMKELVGIVREDRSRRSFCYSAQPGVDVAEVLSSIVASEIYKKDYDSITRFMLTRDAPYEEAISVLRAIIDAGVFASTDHR